MTDLLGGRRHVWLVGMPGSGKSAAGRILADRLRLPFVDLDREVERIAGRTVVDIFEQEAEAGFRALEARALASVAASPMSVVATGGGAVLLEENRRLMRRTGLVLHLSVDEQDALARLAADRAVRPVLAEPGSWGRLAAKRDPLYGSVADMGFSERTGATPEEIAEDLREYVSGGFAVGVALAVRVGPGYDVVLEYGLLRRLRLWLPEPPPGGTAFVVADPAVSARYLDPALSAVEDAGWQAVHLGVPPGEEAKTLAVAEALYRQLAVREAQRDDLLVAVGGGATGDLVGFVAATFLRGMPFVQVPTTLLAMVDASIGGKTAVNLPAGKNLVGAFHQPVAVLADLSTLSTLPAAELRSGLGEIAKYALVFDGGLVELVERNPGGLVDLKGTVDGDLWMDVVSRCVGIKAGVVARDERDSHERLFLNYGHTLGHALERIDEFRGRSHGEAVAIGMVFAARLAERLGVAKAGLVERHVRLLEPLGLPIGGSLPPPSEVLGAMRMDKKRRGALRFVLLEDVGRPTVVTDVADEVVVETLEAM